MPGDRGAFVVADAAAVKPPVFFGQVIGRMAPAGTGRHDIQMRKDPDHGLACADLRPAAAVIFAQLRFKTEPAAQLQRVVQSLRAACAVGRVIGHVYAGDALYPAQLPKGAFHFFVVHFILPAVLPADDGSMR